MCYEYTMNGNQKKTRVGERKSKPISINLSQTVTTPTIHRIGCVGCACVFPTVMRFIVLIGNDGNGSSHQVDIMCMHASSIHRTVITHRWLKISIPVELRDCVLKFFDYKPNFNGFSMCYFDRGAHFDKNDVNNCNTCDRICILSLSRAI